MWKFHYIAIHDVIFNMNASRFPWISIACWGWHFSRIISFRQRRQRSYGRFVRAEPPWRGKKWRTVWKGSNREFFPVLFSLGAKLGVFCFWWSSFRKTCITIDSCTVDSLGVRLSYKTWCYPLHISWRWGWCEIILISGEVKIAAIHNDTRGDTKRHP